MLVFGHAGTPILAFPSSMGRFYEWEDFGMAGAIAPQLESGHNRLFCLDSVDAESFYNKGVDPHTRMRRHGQYEQYVMHEALPFAEHATGQRYVIAAGASFGGYHAANLFFKHIGRFGKLLALSGSFDVKSFLDGYYSDDVYYSCPADYLPGLTNPHALEGLRHTQIVLTTGEHDPCRGANEHLSGVLTAKNVPHTLDFAPGEFAHDWPWWRAQLARHIA